MPDGDWGEEYLAEMDRRKAEGERAAKWKVRAERAEELAQQRGAALAVAEQALAYVQPYVGLLDQYLDHPRRRVAAARECANAVLRKPKPKADSNVA